MDLGLMGLNGLVGSDACIDSSDAETKQKWYYTGSGFLKQERSQAAAEDNLRSLKVAKTEQMLSFSSPKSESVTLPNFYHHSSSPCSRNTGYGFGGLNAESMHGVLTGVRSPFTPSQWMELEHQALIYKYINSNVPIPSNLLIPIRRALESAGIYGFSGGPLRPGTLGWGAFHFGYSNNTDPEPGRCRRTDGKKWRCSRDAVADQKYCERHVNRGRHRSRKPVEGQKGHSVSGTTATTAAKLMAVASSASELVVPGGGASSSIGLSQHPQLKSLQPSAPNPCASSPHMNRFHMPELKENPYEESSRAEFGHVYSDSLLNPLHRSSSLITCRNNGNRESESQHSVHQFLDDKTLLSISIPETASDFMSSTSSSTNHKLALSPLRLSREMDSEMDFQVGSAINGSSQRQVNWIPISWDASVGGPLGEVLHSSSNSSPRLAPSSPTGVLQRTNNTFWSLSNCSAGSSPRAESHVTREGARPCNDLLAGLVTI